MTIMFIVRCLIFQYYIFSLVLHIFLFNVVLLFILKVEWVRLFSNFFDEFSCCWLDDTCPNYLPYLCSLFVAFELLWSFHVRGGCLCNVHLLLVLSHSHGMIYHLSNCAMNKCKMLYKVWCCFFDCIRCHINFFRWLNKYSQCTI